MLALPPLSEIAYSVLCRDQADYFSHGNKKKIYVCRIMNICINNKEITSRDGGLFPKDIVLLAVVKF